MIRIPDCANKRVAVFGLGRAGIAAIDALLASGAQVYAWDDKKESVDNYKPKSGVVVAPPDNYDWKEIVYLVLSPGVPFTNPEPHAVVKLARKANCPIICDIELLYKAVPDAKYIGITGTNGKSTTTAMIGHICKIAGLHTAVGGNIGTSASTLPVLPNDGVYVLEVSSYQLDLIDRTRFNISVLLNVTPDHLDRHGDMEGYIKAKKRIYLNQGKNDFAIIAVDDEHTEKVYKDLKKAGVVKLIPVSCRKPCADGVFVDQGIIYDNISGTEQQFSLGKLKRLPGKHNEQNIAAAYAALVCMGIKRETIVEAIKTFQGLKHRIEYVAEIKGINFVNDSKATNAEAAEKAILSFDNIFWIAGGMPKAGGIASLEILFPKIRKAFLIGQAEEEFAKTLDGKVKYERCGNLKTALDKAAQAAFKENIKNSVVLLSPACASFDQFKSYEERGNIFCNLVQELKAKDV